MAHSGGSELSLHLAFNWKNNCSSYKNGLLTILVCLAGGRPLRAFLQRDGHQQHLRVSLLDAGGPLLHAALHGGPVVPAEETGLGPPQRSERRRVGPTALHGPSHLPQR